MIPNTDPKTGIRYGVSYPSPEGEGLSAALCRSVPESEIYPDLQASLRAATICGGPRLAGTLASCLLEIASNRISAIPFRARIQPAMTGSTQSGLPRGCLMRPSHGVECMDTISSLSKAKHGEYGKKLAAFLQGLKSLASCRIGA